MFAYMCAYMHTGASITGSLICVAAMYTCHACTHVYHLRRAYMCIACVVHAHMCIACVVHAHM